MRHKPKAKAKVPEVASKPRIRPDFRPYPDPAPEEVAGIRQQLVAGRKLLRGLVNMRNWMEANRDRMPPISLDSMDKAIAEAREAGIELPE
jgi:hypothetical protein